jgi:hypothetical protein
MENVAFVEALNLVENVKQDTVRATGQWCAGVGVAKPGSLHGIENPTQLALRR